MADLIEARPRAALPYLDARQRAFDALRPLDGLAAHTVTASDGVPLAAFEAGDRDAPTVLVVNALGVSAAFVAPLAARLAERHRVILWESRGLPDGGGEAADLSLARHAQDAADVLAALGGANGHANGRANGHVAAIVAYCSGANIAAYALDERLLAAGRLVIVSPSMEVAGVTERTLYQKSVLPLWQRIADGGAAYAGLVRVLLNQARRVDDGSLDYQLATLNGLPFGDDASICRYAAMQAACLREDWAARLARLALPALVLHGARDDVIHAATSRGVADALAGATLETIDDAGHFGVYTSRALQDRVAAFLNDGGAGRAAPQANDQSDKEQ
ncbi:alpha/beta fold hydrolase [Burkholderia stagnalis]|uniref:Alpha/beta fold hydrolase n=1 Tax=Burkholderia stagnalis TaxID=1503054 RepID=A0ABX9YNC9_9BURK|nr:alpha/beta fold hydrolase [Burkholderia stagnalis]RQQ59931.1 alpha/beta fold hydrolase [Burkholderia stagnalis]RQQ66250.1 alpha/beta fold hydrolase [Burkholderia stagnalis]RQQ69196.1 alpha/beta fold hydrolase [Burkholderia stagnalis]RQQ81582.1 alpha/beta fold hydrolase [Burkholderia stagnalis]RQQ86167.1 alpha/beta fold hydrolase [Burkholderia stagnalis]